MTPLFTVLNGLHPRTADVIFASWWTLMINSTVPHLIEAAIYYQALQLGCACHYGSQRVCEEHRG